MYHPTKTDIDYMKNNLRFIETDWFLNRYTLDYNERLYISCKIDDWTWSISTINGATAYFPNVKVTSIDDVHTLIRIFKL